MNERNHEIYSSFSRVQQDRASHWVARHERGLSEKELEEFEQWLSSDPSNESCFFEHQIAWASFDVMDEWKPTYSSVPNPDLFEAKPRRKWNWFMAIGGMAAALLIGVALLKIPHPKADDSATIANASYMSQANEKHFLEDGSSFYLLTASEVKVSYSKSQRVIEFVNGEAHFSVAHDPSRPFIVQSKIGRVTALGTVFSVRRDSSSWEVFVTEGKVKVEESGVDDGSPASDRFSTELVAGQRIIQKLSNIDFSPTIDAISDNELKEKLAWKDQIIDMVSAPLEEILYEFRRFDRREVIIDDKELKRMRMTVAIKPDNLEDFIDLLELSAGVKAADTSSGSILLSRATH